MKRLPHHPQAERALLASVLGDCLAFDLVDGLVTEADFHVPAHGTIWLAFRAIAARKLEIDGTTLRGELDRVGKLSAVGGDEYLLGLCDTIPSAGPETFARIIRTAARRRALIRACQEQAERGYDDDIETKTWLDETEARIFDATKPDAMGGGPIHAKDGIAKFWEHAMANQKAGGLLGVRSGIAVLDAVIGGFRNAELTVVGARPSMGKSAFLETCALNAIADGKRVLYFSVEMAHETLWPRLLAKVTDIDSTAIRDLKLTADGFADAKRGIQYLSSQGLFVDDDSDLTIAQLRGRARRHQREHGVDIVLVDYLQYVHAAKRHDRRDLEVGEVSRGLKSLAKDLGIPVVVAAQVNRGSTQRSDKRPSKSDLRESGSIEQDADMIIFPHREAYYRREEVEMGRRKAEHDEVFDEARTELIIDKNRSGRTGTVVCRYEATRCEFVDDDRPQQQPANDRGGFRDE